MKEAVHQLQTHWPSKSEYKTRNSAQKRTWATLHTALTVRDCKGFYLGNLTVPAIWAPNTSAGKQKSNNGIWTWQDKESAVYCDCFNFGMLLWYLHPGNRVSAGKLHIFKFTQANDPKDIFIGYFISRTEANHLNGISKFYNSSTLLPEKWPGMSMTPNLQMSYLHQSLCVIFSCSCRQNIVSNVQCCTCSVSNHKNDSLR